MNSLSNVPSGVFNGRVAVYIGQLAEAESVVVLVAWVGEPVDDDRVVVCVVNLTHSAVQLVVGNGGPVERFLVFNSFLTNLT